MEHTTNDMPAAPERELLTEIDAALDEDRARERSRRDERRAKADEIVQQGGKLGQLLRYLGTTVLAASALTFLVQHWEAADHIGRYFSFLAFTVVLAASGFICGLRMREDKGARTFLALAAASVPVNAVSLGALLYSLLPAARLTKYPAHLLWVAPSATAAIVTALVGSAVVSVVALLGFSALVRAERSLLTGAFLTLTAVLMLPVRDPDVVAMLAAGMLLGNIALERAFAGRAPMSTREGVIARTLLFLPVTFLAVRTVMLYDPTALFSAVILAGAGLAVFNLAPAYFREESGTVRVFQIGAMLPIGSAMELAVSELQRTGVISNAGYLPALCLPMAAAFLAMSAFARDGGATHRAWAAFVAIGGVSLQLLVHPGIESSILCVAASLITTTYGYAAERKAFFLWGLAGLMFGLIYNVRYAVELYSASPWLSLAVLGVATLIAASVIERHFQALRREIGRLRESVRTWH